MKPTFAMFEVVSDGDLRHKSISGPCLCWLNINSLLTETYFLQPTYSRAAQAAFVLLITRHSLLINYLNGKIPRPEDDHSFV